MKIIACYSNKGGVGKTATAVNLAYALAAAGRRTLLCDLDPQGASGFYFRVKPSRKLTEASFFKDVEKFTKAIRGSDYENLDILPANMGFRDFDVFLSRMREPRSRLKKALGAVKGDYDVILLDCPPNISTLSENVFRAADAVLVPVIPTTLSQRTFDQLVGFFKENKLAIKKLHGFFSMVQGTKKLHDDTRDAMLGAYGKTFMAAQIPFASEVERMGVHRAPVMATSPNSAASKDYHALCAEMMQRLDRR
ncbi:MAG: ParA family protein [Cypionkella sp.]